MPTPKKLEKINEIKEKMSNAQSLIFTDFKGLTVQKISDFRIRLREQQAEYHVYKNTLTRIAIQDTPYAEKINEHLEGTTAVIIANGDPVAPLKVLKDFERTSKIPLKVGVIDGVAYDVPALAVLRELPNKDQMRGMLLGVIQSPIRNFVSLLAAPSRDLLSVLKAKADKDSE